MALTAVASGNPIRAGDLNQLINLLTGAMTDQVVTIANALKITPVAGGAAAPTSYGSVPVKLDEKSGVSANYDFTGIPGGYRNLELRVHLRDNSAATAVAFCAITFNADTGANYTWLDMSWAATAGAPSEHLNQTSLGLAVSSGGGQAAGQYSSATIRIYSYADATSEKLCDSNIQNNSGDATGNFVQRINAGKWKTSSGAVTEIKITPGQGTGFDVNSWAELWGHP